MARLEVRDVVVRFGGLTALAGVDVAVSEGEVAGLIGPNGAGKTTLFNVITGLQSSTAGRVSFDDVDLTRLRPTGRARRGLARTFQRLETFNSLPVEHNVRVAAETRRRWDRSGPGPAEETAALLDRLGLAALGNVMVGALPTGTARLVELARALAARPRILLLDEPSSGLDGAETEALGALLRELVSERGIGILLVEHDMEFVMGLCAHIHVLDFGTVIATGTPAEVQADPAVQRAYLGGVA